MALRLRVTMSNGSQEEFDGNQTLVANDGSLLISKITTAQEERTDFRTGQRGIAQVQESRLLAIIRRDLWERVETLGEMDKDADPIMFQQVAPTG